MLKVKTHPDYPPEEGKYIRGNDASPVAIAIIHYKILDEPNGGE